MPDMTPADLQATVAHMGSLARAAGRVLAASPVSARNAALRALAGRLRDGTKLTVDAIVRASQSGPFGQLYVPLQWREGEAY